MALALAVATAVSGWGQVATGAPPFATLSGGPDIVDLADLNVHIAIPVVSKVGVGIPFDYLLSYDSAIWAPSTAWQPAPNWGWRGETEAATGYLTALELNQSCRWTRNGIQFYTEDYTLWTEFTYHDPFGVAHVTSAWARSDPGGHCGGSRSASGTAADGSGYTVFANAGGGSVQARNGTAEDAPFESTSGAGSITDPNGNKITTNGSSFTDTLGQTALSISGSQTPGSTMTLTYSTASGGTAQVIVHYGSYAVATDFAGCTPTAYSTSAAPLVSEIDLPDGTAYHFTYLGDGRLSSMTLPSGGVITYQYSGGSGGILCDGSTATLTRTTPDGAWVYQHSENGSAWTTTVTDPKGNQTEYQFQGIYQTEMQAYAGAMGGTPLKIITTCYNGAAAPCNATAISLPITQRTRFLSLDNGLEDETNQTYNGYGLPLEDQQYAFGQGSPGGLYRQTVVTYATLAGIQDHPSEIQVDDGEGNLLRQTNFNYNTTGNVTSIARWVSGSSYDTTQFTVNANGAVASQTDPMGHATSFTYGTGSCNGAFPTQTKLANALTTQATWNCYLGAPATAVNADGQTTTFQYNDPFGRLTEVDAPAGQVAVIAYDDAANTVDQYASTTADTSPGDSGWRHERDTYDWDGRPIEHDLVNDPGGLSKTLTTYNPRGLVASVSNPFRSTSDPTYGLTQYAYDPLGRTVAITNPDGSQAAIAYGSGADLPPFTGPGTRMTLPPLRCPANLCQLKVEFSSSGRRKWPVFRPVRASRGSTENLQ